MSAVDKVDRVEWMAHVLVPEAQRAGETLVETNFDGHVKVLVRKRTQKWTYLCGSFVQRRSTCKKNREGRAEFRSTRCSREGERSLLAVVRRIVLIW